MSFDYISLSLSASRNAHHHRHLHHRNHHRLYDPRDSSKPSLIETNVAGSINSTNLRRLFASYIHDFPANLRLTKNPLPRIRHELGFDDIIRGVNSAVGRSVEIGNIGADRPGKNTAPIFYREPSQLFRHNERVYGRNYAKLYAATRSNALETTRGKRGDPIFAEYTRSRRGGIYRRADTENGSGRRDVRTRFELIIPSRGSR